MQLGPPQFTKSSRTKSAEKPDRRKGPAVASSQSVVIVSHPHGQPSPMPTAQNLPRDKFYIYFISLTAASTLERSRIPPDLIFAAARTLSLPTAANHASSPLGSTFISAIKNQEDVKIHPWHANLGRRKATQDCALEKLRTRSLFFTRDPTFAACSACLHGDGMPIPCLPKECPCRRRTLRSSATPSTCRFQCADAFYSA